MVVLRTPARKAIFLTLILLVVGVLLVFLMVVRDFLTPTHTAPATSSSVSTSNTGANAAAATAVAYMKLVKIVGQPTVKIVSGTTFEADGQIKNVATSQHNITLKIILLDTSGHVVGTATHTVENVKSGVTANYAIQGTASQSSWSSVEVAVINVS